MNINKGIQIGGSVSNSQLNTGNRVKQDASWGQIEKNQITKFIEEIKNNPHITSVDSEKAEQVVNDLKELQEVGQLKPSILKTMWGGIPAAVQTLTAATNIYKIFNGEKGSE